VQLVIAQCVLLQPARIAMPNHCLLFQGEEGTVQSITVTHPAVCHAKCVLFLLVLRRFGGFLAYPRFPTLFPPLRQQPRSRPYASHLQGITALQQGCSLITHTPLLMHTHTFVLRPTPCLIRLATVGKTVSRAPPSDASEPAIRCVQANT